MAAARETACERDFDAARMRLFGRSKKKETEGPQESIVQMRATLEMLEKKEKHLESKIAAETGTAKQYAVSNKSSTSGCIGGTAVVD